MTAPAPTTAIGYTQAPQYSQLAYEDETTPELQWPQSVTVYDQMRRTDSQVASVLRAVTLPVRRTPWRIDPNGARDEVVQLVADDLGLPIVGQTPKSLPRTKDRFSWSEHLRLALLMLPMGASYFEQVYRVEDDASRAHLRKLEWRPLKTIDDIDVAPDGGLISIKQYWTQTNTSPKPIPVSRLVAYVHEREGGNWLGQSVLRSAYKNWLLKDRLLRVQAQTIERNGMGIPVYEGAETERSLDQGMALTQSLRAGAAAGTAIPFGAKLRLMGVEGTLPDADPVVRYHDEQIARAVLAHFLNLGTQTGSWALGTTFADFFTLSLQTLAQQIADVATQHIIEDLVDVNFGEQEPAPRLVFDEIGSRQQATAQAIKLLVDAGLITPDQVLDETLRQQYGLPPADPATAKPAPTQGEPSRAPEPEPVPGEGSVAASSSPVVAHLPGQHNQESHGNSVSSPNAVKGIKVFDNDKYEKTYGEIVDDKGVRLADDLTLTARYFENGDLHVALDLEGGKTQVFQEMEPEGLRQLAYNLEDVLAVDETELEGGDPYGIVADAYSPMHDFYVAKDGIGDIRITPPDAEDDDYLGLSAQDATDFVNALLDMADAYEEHFADDGEVVAKRAVTAHLSGQHDQKDHGRRLPKSLSGDSPFSGFSREQLRKAARRRGIELARGEDRGSIERKLAKHLAGDDATDSSGAPESTERAILDAYGALPKWGSGWASLADLRDHLGSSERSDVDAALKEMSRRQDIILTPENDQSSLTPRQRAAAISLGGQPQYHFKPSTKAPTSEDAAPVEVAPTASPARMTKAQYTSLLTDEFVRLSMLRGTSEDDARKQAGADPSIDDLKERNTVLRAKLRQKGVDYRTEEQKRTDDAEKNRLLDEVERLANEAGHDGPAKRAGASKMSRRELAAFVADATEFQKRKKAKRTAEGKGSSAAAAFKAAEDKSRATSRQVGYIKGLLRERGLSGEATVPGGGPTSSEDIRKLSNAEARAYINRLLRGDY